MIRTLFAASALALTAAAPLAAQPMTTAGGAGTMSASDVGMQPMMGVPPAEFVKQAAASDMFEIESAKVALGKSRTKGVQGFAQMMIRDHTTTTRQLKTALMHDKSVPPPPAMLPPDKQALLTQLRGTPTKDFDHVYWQQQLQAHQQAWALHKGFSTDGSDPALRKVAAGAVPIVEEHLKMIKSAMTTAGGPM